MDSFDEIWKKYQDQIDAENVEKESRELKEQQTRRNEEEAEQWVRAFCKDFALRMVSAHVQPDVKVWASTTRTIFGGRKQNFVFVWDIARYSRLGYSYGGGRCNHDSRWGPCYCCTVYLRVASDGAPKVEISGYEGDGYSWQSLRGSIKADNPRLAEYYKKSQE